MCGGRQLTTWFDANKRIRDRIRVRVYMGTSTAA